ncbi:MAG: cytochrome C552, partial [Sedimenticolaceae bacterium]
MSDEICPAAKSLIRGLLALGLMLAVSTAFAARPAGEIGKDWGDPAGEECVECHWTENPGLSQEWNHSQHGQAGVNCLDCHKA